MLIACNAGIAEDALLSPVGVDAARGGDALERLLLEADNSVQGSLAFRLVGNRTRGVFVYGVSESSEQCRILKNGDRFVNINGIDVSRMTCDQVANILRLSMLRDGVALLTVNKAKEGVLRKFDRPVAVDVDNNEVDWPSEKTLYTFQRDDPLHSSVSENSVFNRTQPRLKTERQYAHEIVDDSDSLHLMCFDELNTRELYHCKRRKTCEVSWQSRAETQNGAVKWRCSVCYKYVKRRRWHMLKHEWALGAKKFLPHAASEFFDLRRYENVHYTLL